jgi:hypothetical protein
MADLTIQAVEIKLGAEYTQDTTIGLYTVSGTSYLRWSEATLTGVAETWKTEILLKNGIGDIEASGSLARGGNLAEYGGMEICVANAEALIQSLKDLEINLTGLSVTVTEFIGTAANSDATSRTIIFTGIVEDIKWGDTDLIISLKNSLYKRETNLSTTNADGVTTPVVFGKLCPPTTKIVDGVAVASTEINNLAKFVRTVDTEDKDTYNNSYFDNDGVSYPLIKTFPIETIYSDNLHYTCRMPGVAGKASLPTPVDIYVIESGGQIREITEWSCLNGTGYFVVYFKVKDAFLTELIATGDTRTWIQFVKIGREFSAETWWCKDFLKSTDGSATLTPELFSYTDDKFNRIADFGLTVKDSDKNNTLDIDGSQYSNDIDTLESFIALPITSLSLETTTHLPQWNCNGIDFDAYKFNGGISAYQVDKIVDGIYSNAGFFDGITISNNSLLDSANSYDKISSSYAEFSPNMSMEYVFPYVWSNLAYLKVLKFSLPVLPLKINIEKIYLGIKLNSRNDYSSSPGGLTSPFFVIMRRFSYSKSTDMILDDKNVTTAERTVAGLSVENIMDRHYSDNPSTNNLKFYKSGVIAGGEYSSLQGYELFEITSSENDYNTFLEGGLFFNRWDESVDAPFSIDDITKIYEICIIIKLSSSSIKKEIYSPLSGRQFDNTWGSRRTDDSLMENPKDIIEHCDRLKNWSEIAGHTVKDWGHEYSSDALIKTSGAGSFDSTNLNYLTDQKVAMEITDADKQNTTSIVKKICDSFGLCSFIDNAGNECIETLELTNPTGSANTITLTDQIGAIGDVEEPRVENVFCEPVVNYLFNQGSGEYDRTLKVTNIDAASWVYSYTPGYTLADGETVWNSCKLLYNQFRHITLCPSEFSDQCCIADYATAVYYVKRKIAWMNKMRLPKISIAYSKGKDYYIYKHLMVQLPMHTNNVSVECIIEKIVKSKNSNQVKLNVVVLEPIVE